MERHDIDQYGPHMSLEAGYIAQVGFSKYKHRFGGKSWRVKESESNFHKPTLLIVLDLLDPKLNILKINQLIELPLFSCINCVWAGKQIYTFDNREKYIHSIEYEIQNPEILDTEYWMPQPIPEKPLSLTDMKEDDNPSNENLYTKCCDDFLGGKGTIRVLGPPIWLQAVEEKVCSCGQNMKYVASIGYEVDNEHRQLIDTTPYFIGELANYFFMCKDCQKIVVLSQST